MDISARGYANPDLLWTPDTLAQRMARPGLSIIDTRPDELFARGRQEFEGTDKRARRGGAIPGAVHRDWEQHYKRPLVNSGSTWMAPEQLSPPAEKVHL